MRAQLCAHCVASGDGFACVPVAGGGACWLLHWATATLRFTSARASIPGVVAQGWCSVLPMHCISLWCGRSLRFVVDSCIWHQKARRPIAVNYCLRAVTGAWLRRVWSCVWGTHDAHDDSIGCAECGAD